MSAVLFLSYDNYEEPDFDGPKYVMSPPLRDRAKQAQLWRGLAFNDLQCISTDHCPFCMKEKRLGEHDFSKIPNGAPGIETRMSLVYDGGVRDGTDLDESVCRTDRHVARQDLRTVPAQGDDRARIRRRHCRLRPQSHDDALRKNPAHERRLQPVPRDGK